MPKLSLTKQLQFSFLLALSALAFSSKLHATQADIDAEVASYIDTFSGSNMQLQRKALETLSWSGIQSEAVYDTIEKNLQALKDTDNKFEKQTVYWYAKALGYSGMEKYRPTLSSLAKSAKSKKVKKYAGIGLTSLDQYKVWNSIISKNDVSAPTGRLLETRVATMLAASDYSLVRLGAKRAYHGHKQDAELAAKAAARLESDFLDVDKKNDDQVDAISWLVKVLAESGDSQYKPLLVKVANEAKVKKLKKYAKKYAEYL